MTTRIVCAGEKGGPGKSTVAEAIAVGVIKAGATAAIADMDPQKTCVDWAIAREQHREQMRQKGRDIPPPVPVRYFGNLSEAVNEGDRYDFSVIDSPGKRGPEILAIAQVASIVVLPSNCGSADMWPTIRAHNELVRKGISRSKLIVVLNHVGGASEERAARKYLTEECGMQVLDLAIREKVAYRSAMTAGLSIAEVPGESKANAGLRAEAAAVVGALIDKIIAIREAGNGFEVQGSKSNAA